MRISSVRNSRRCAKMPRKRGQAARSRRARPTSSQRAPVEIRGAARARVAAAPRCPRCSSPIPPNPNGRGRPRVWCSQVCRRAAYEERRAAASGAIAKEVVVKQVEPPWEETIERVLRSPKACQQVLRSLRQRLAADELSISPWNEVSSELFKLNDEWATQWRRLSDARRNPPTV